MHLIFSFPLHVYIFITITPRVHVYPLSLPQRSDFFQHYILTVFPIGKAHSLPYSLKSQPFYNTGSQSISLAILGCYLSSVTHLWAKSHVFTPSMWEPLLCPVWFKIHIQGLSSGEGHTQMKET